MGPISSVHRLVVALGAVATGTALAAIAGVDALSILARAPAELAAVRLPFLGGLVVLLMVLQQQGFVFHWGERTTKVSLDELGIFLGLLVLSPAEVVLAVAAASGLNQALHRRARDKAVFNVAQYAVAAMAAGATAALVQRFAGLAAPWHAVPAPFVFSATTALLLSFLFGRMDSASPARVFLTRFGAFVVAGGILGVSLGLIVWALYAAHPLAVLAAVPVFVYLRRFGRLTEWADDELITHRLVASLTGEVAGIADLDAVAARILVTCHDLFDCGEASLTLAAPGASARVWRRSFGAAEGFGGVTAEIQAPDGSPLGALSAFPQPGQRRYGERELQLLRTVAASAAAAAANADALRAAREANQELAASEERYRSFFETAHLLIHVLDHDGYVLEQNPAATGALGWSSAEVRSRCFDELLTGDKIVERLRSEDEVFGVETRLRTARGDDVHVLVDARALAGEQGRYVVFSRDITPLKELESELRRSMGKQHETIKRLENMNRELEEFTLWTTHDMREPLRSIGTIAQFLHEDLGTVSTEEARDLARRISEGADRLKERVKALHAFSLIVQRDDEFQDVDMQDVVEGVVMALETKISEKGATILLPATRLPVVRAQPHRIDQVFGNLVENALKYGRAVDAQVRIGVHETELEWRFFVEDDGPGIPAHYQERIFQLFQRGPETRESGSGAGLAIVKRIAEQHGGRAWVESDPGKGACFFVALPKPAPRPATPLLSVTTSHARPRKPF